MRKNPERLAWLILAVSFLICIGSAVGTPLVARAYILSAQRIQNISLEVQQGTLRVTRAGRGVPIAIAERYDDVPERSIVTTDLAQGRLVFHAPQEEDGLVVASVQLYDNTEIVLSAARSPRFPTSRLPHAIALEVRAGRVRINVADTKERSTTADVLTPHGTIALTEGSYEIKVNVTATEVTVRHGQANIRTGSQAKSLDPAERAIIGNGQIDGPLLATRNLVTDGDFQAELAGWESSGEQTDPEQPLGIISVVANEGRQVVDFYRMGTNHSEIRIQQDINYDVRDFTSLELHLAVRIISEEFNGGFAGCGYLGSECPIIVLLEYKDTQGTDREWLHGFYIGEPHPEWLTHGWAEAVPSGNWQAFDSGNLMMSDPPPALIKRLLIKASGHSFHAMVTEVELLAQE